MFSEETKFWLWLDVATLWVLECLKCKEEGSEILPENILQSLKYKKQWLSLERETGTANCWWAKNIIVTVYTSEFLIMYVYYLLKNKHEFYI